jgi:hypothetical protein
VCFPEHLDCCRSMRGSEQVVVEGKQRKRSEVRASVVRRIIAGMLCSRPSAFLFKPSQTTKVSAASRSVETGRCLPLALAGSARAPSLRLRREWKGVDRLLAKKKGIVEQSRRIRTGLACLLRLSCCLVMSCDRRDSRLTRPNGRRLS